MRYEVWALEQLRDKPRCRVEPSMKCIPLRNDPICTACYEGSQTPAKGSQTPAKGSQTPAKGSQTPAKGSTLLTGRKEQDAE